MSDATERNLASLEALLFIHGEPLSYKKIESVLKLAKGEAEPLVAEFKKHLEDSFPTLHLIGRNGMHKYNNQDHAMMTAMLTVENILAGKNIYDVWKVNQDAEYHENEVILEKNNL